MTDDYQCRGDPTIQHFMLDESSGLKNKSGEVIETGVSNVWNQVNLNGGISFVGDGSYVDTAFIVQVSTDLYYEYIKLSGSDLRK